MNNITISKLSENSKEKNLEFFFINDKEYFKSNLEKAEYLMRYFKEQSLTTEEQIKLGKGIGEFFQGLTKNKDNQNNYNSIYNSIKGLIEKEENLDLFKSLQNTVDNSSYHSFWRGIILESYLCDKTQNYIDFSKINTYSLDLKKTGFSDNTKSKFIDYNILNDNLGVLDNNYDIVDELILDDSRKELIDKIEESYKDGHVYKSLLFGEFNNLSQEIKKSFIYNISPKLDEIDEFYNYDTLNPPLVSDYDIDETLLKIDFDDELSPSDDDVVDHYVGALEYIYDKENESFYKLDDDGEIEEDISFEDARSGIYESRSESFEFNLADRYEIKSEELFKEEYSYYGDRVDISIKSLNGYDDNQDFDDYVGEYTSQRREYDHIESINYDKQIEIFNFLLEKLYGSKKFKNDYTVSSIENVSKAFDNYFENLNHDDKVNLIKELQDDDNLNIKELSSYSDYYKYFSYDELLQEYQDYVKNFILSVNCDFKVSQSDYYDIKSITLDKIRPCFYIDRIKDLPNDFNYDETLKEVELKLEKLTRTAYHFKEFNNIIPAYSKSFINKEKTLKHLNVGNFYIFENKYTCNYLNDLSTKETFDIFKGLISTEDKNTFLKIIIKGTSLDFQVKLFDEVKNSLGKGYTKDIFKILDKIIPSVIESTDRNPLIELSNFIKENKLVNINVIYNLLYVDNNKIKELNIFKDYVNAVINEGLDNGLDNPIFTEQNYNLRTLLYTDESKDLLYKLYELSSGRENDITDIFIRKPNKKIEDFDVFCKYYYSDSKETLEDKVLGNIDMFTLGNRELANYIIDKIKLVDNIKSSKDVISLPQNFKYIVNLLYPETLKLLLTSENVNKSDRISIFETLLLLNTKDNYFDSILIQGTKDNNGNIKLYDFEALGKDTIFSLFELYGTNYVLNTRNSNLYSLIFPSKDSNFLKSNFIVSVLKEFLKENFGYIGEVNRELAIEPTFIKTDYLLKKVYTGYNFYNSFDYSLFKYFSYDNISSIININSDLVEGYQGFLNNMLNNISENNFEKYYEDDKKNGYLILRKIVATGSGLKYIKQANYITDDFIELINKDYSSIGVQVTKGNIFSIQELLVAKLDSDLYLGKISSLSNKELIDGLYNLGYKYFTCDFFKNLNSEDSLYLLNHKIYAHNDLEQTYKIISNLNLKDFNSYLKIFIKTRHFGYFLEKYGELINFSKISNEFVYSLPEEFRDSSYKLDSNFLDVLFKLGYSREIIIDIIDISDLLDVEKDLIKNIIKNFNASMSDTLRIINEDAREELESEIKFTISSLVNNFDDYNKIPEVKNINDINRKAFINAGLDINKFNCYNNKIDFSSSENVDLKSIYDNLESSLVNQYKVIFGEGDKKGLVHGIKHGELKYVSKNVLDMYNISLKELGKNIKNIHKGVGLELDNGGLYLKDNNSMKTLGNNANLLINTMGNSTQIIDKAFLFKDEFLNTLNKTEKIIFNKVKKSVVNNIDELYKDKSIDKIRINEINDFLFKINTRTLTNEIKSIFRIVSDKSKTIIKSHIHTFSNSKLKGTLRNLDIENINIDDIRNISGFMRIVSSEEKKSLGILIKEYKKLESLNTLKSNCNNLNINNFKRIFKKLINNPDLNNEDTEQYFINISSNLKNNNTNLNGFINKVEELYRDIPENREVKSLYNYILEVKMVLQHFNEVKSSVISHIKDDFGNIDVDKIKEVISEKRDYTIKLWDRNNLIENLNQGYYTHCCISPTGINGWSMPKYIVSENFNIIELRNNNKIVGQAFCYIGVQNNKYNLVIDNVEINNSYSVDSDLIKTKLLSFIKDYRDSIGKLDDTIKIGDNYNDVKINGIDLKVSHIIGYKDMYLDSYKKQREFI